jgi:hypothetical protein
MAWATSSLLGGPPKEPTAKFPFSNRTTTQPDRALTPSEPFNGAFPNCSPRFFMRCESSRITGAAIKRMRGGHRRRAKRRRFSTTSKSRRHADFANATDQQLWFQQSGNNLAVDLIGIKDSATIRNWYGSNAGAQLANVNDSANNTITNTQIALLVQAMASYASANPGPHHRAPCVHFLINPNPIDHPFAIAQRCQIGGEGLRIGQRRVFAEEVELSDTQLGAAMLVAKLKGARDRKKRLTGKCGGRKSHRELNPEVVTLARSLFRLRRRTKTDGGKKADYILALKGYNQGGNFRLGSTVVGC